MGVRTPGTCWAVNKRQVVNWRDCCIWLVNLFEFLNPHPQFSHNFKYQRCYLYIILPLSFKNLKVSPRLCGKSKEKVISVYFKKALAALNSTGVIINMEVFCSTDFCFPLWGQNVYFNTTVLLMEHAKKKQSATKCLRSGGVTTSNIPVYEKMTLHLTFMVPCIVRIF
jgi:hypothetical protein